MVSTVGPGGIAGTFAAELAVTAVVFVGVEMAAVAVLVAVVDELELAMDEKSGGTVVVVGGDKTADSNKGEQADVVKQG